MKASVGTELVATEMVFAPSLYWAMAIRAFAMLDSLEGFVKHQLHCLHPRAHARHATTTVTAPWCNLET